MGNKTVLYQMHLDCGGKLVEFAGYDMPIHYGSQVDEHHFVRTDAGMFDVSHMVIVDLSGDDTFAFLQYLLANDVAKLTPGRAMYGCMLNEEGGIIDDLITYDEGEGCYRLVVNAATRDKDLAWIEKQSADYDVNVNVRDDLAMIAVQGPNAADKAASVMPTEFSIAMLALKPFHAASSHGVMVARTGYTGEDGFEIMLPNDQACELWMKLLEAGVKPCGLGARDTLRLEAGMSLYGLDMDDSVTPLESGLSWTVAMKDDRDFIGREALEAIKAEGVFQKMVGLVLEDKGVIRSHQKVLCESGEGEVTSGTFSPTLGVSVALARIPHDAKETCLVEIRNKQLKALIVRPPFVRHGEKVFG